jgi:hypothetical protein
VSAWIIGVVLGVNTSENVIVDVVACPGGGLMLNPAPVVLALINSQ